jgi:hypothetical protein
MELVWELKPVAPFHIIAIALTLALVVILLVGLVLRWQNLSKNKFIAGFIALCSLFAGLMFLIAIFNPSRVTQPDRQDFHLSVVVDVSQSITRNPEWRTDIDPIASFLQDNLSQLSDNIAIDSPASLVVAGNNAVVIPASLGTIANELRQVQPEVVNMSNTNLEGALRASANAIDSSTGRGEIVLITDGNETVGSVYDALPSLSQRGYPVTVIPLSAGSPIIELSAVDLVPQTNADVDTNLRLVIENSGTTNSDVAFNITKNPSLLQDDSLFGMSTQADVSTTIDAGKYIPATNSIIFEGVGLQFADVIVSDARGQEIQHQRRFTNVIRPLKILAFGDAQWQRTLPPDVAEVELVVDPSELDTIDLSLYDSVVVGGVSADEFSTPALEKLATTIRDDGLGFMLINGNHAPAGEEAETILRSYRDTPIDPILPVGSDPRKICPAPRHVILLIDTSGSMSGPPLDQAKAIANHIVELMQEGDVLNVRSFTTGSSVVADIPARECSETMLTTAEEAELDAKWQAEKQNAIDQINRLSASGGTDPTSALNTLNQERIDNCGLFMISDGGFSTTMRARPDCQVFAFAIGGVGALDTLAADVFNVQPGFNPSAINFGFLEAQDRKQFFAFGEYEPWSLAMLGEESLFVPTLNMDGVAVSYPREDADLIAVGSRLRLPVLAYRAERNGNVGYIGTGIPDDWVDTADGREAIKEWIIRTIGYYDRDRYTFDIQDDGRNITLQIEVRSPDNTLPPVESLVVTVETESDTSTARVQRIGQATFEAQLTTLPRTDSTQIASLHITEGGDPNSILARGQRILMLVPPAGNLSQASSSTEDKSIGTNTLLLQDVANLTGGVYAPDDAYQFFESDIQPQIVWEYWKDFAIIGSVIYILTIILRRFGR